jgi:glycosyltransferase involved in cell wall biosynthesis
MRFLRICLDAPYPPNAGGRLDPYYITRELTLRGHQTTLLTFLNEDRDVSPLREICDLHVVPLRGTNSPLNLARGVIERYPVNYVKYRDPEVLAKALDLLRARPHDALVVDQSALGWYVFQLKKLCHIPVVTRWHNLDTLIWERWIDSQANPVKRLLARRQHSFVKRFEYKLAMASDLCLTIGALDTELLRELAPQARIRCLPAGVDLERYRPTNEGREALSLIFLASGYDWHPNWDAAQWLMNEIMPRIWQQIPEAKLYFTGIVHPEMRRWSESGRVVLTGLVPDERAVISKASVLLIPMRLGGGMKLKLPTAFASGKAVVCTTRGAEGVPGLTDGEDLLIRDTPDEFANAVVAVLRDNELRNKLEKNARAFVSRGYDWKVLAEQWEDVMHSVLLPADPCFSPRPGTPVVRGSSPSAGF